jgi:hypothetical protein
VEGVHDDPPHPELDGPGQLGGRLVVAVEAQPLRGESGPLGDGQLAAGAHVEEQALLGDPAGDRRTEERLAGVVHVVAGERIPEHPGAGAEVRLVEHVRR